MKYCSACGAEMADTAKYCLVCGHVLSGTVTEEEPAAAPEQEACAAAAAEEPCVQEAPAAPEGPAEEPAGTEETPEAEERAEETPEEEPADTEEPEPEKEQGTGMLTTVQYFLLEALFAVPVVGTVCLFIFSLCNPKNENLRRFSASVLIWRLIIYILLVAALVVLLLNFRSWAPKLAQYANSFSATVIH